MSKLNESNRKIHLDFHIPHWVRRVGQDFDPERLVQTWKEARVNAVTVVFGCCACGNAYYETSKGKMHPGLQRDLLAPLLPAAREAGIRIYVHFSVGINDRAVIEHPEWAMQQQGRFRYGQLGKRAVVGYERRKNMGMAMLQFPLCGTMVLAAASRVRPPFSRGGRHLSRHGDVP